MSYFSRRNYEKTTIFIRIGSGFNERSECERFSIRQSAHKFKIKHMKISNVLGKFSEFDAQKIDFDPQNKKLKSIEATINTASIDTGIKKRDDHLRTSEYFDVEKFPQIKFVSKKIKGDSIIGDLTIKGVTKEVKLDYDFGGIIDNDGKLKVGFSLDGKISRSDFDIGEDSAMLGDDVKFEIEIEAQAQN